MDLLEEPRKKNGEVDDADDIQMITILQEVADMTDALMFPNEDLVAAAQQAEQENDIEIIELQQEARAIPPNTPIITVAPQAELEGNHTEMTTSQQEVIDLTDSLEVRNEDSVTDARLAEQGNCTQIIQLQQYELEENAVGDAIQKPGLPQEIVTLTDSSVSLNEDCVIVEQESDIQIAELQQEMRAVFPNVSAFYEPSTSGANNVVLNNDSVTAEQGSDIQIAELQQEMRAIFSNAPDCYGPSTSGASNVQNFDLPPEWMAGSRSNPELEAYLQQNISPYIMDLFLRAFTAFLQTLVSPPSGANDDTEQSAPQATPNRKAYVVLEKADLNRLQREYAAKAKRNKKKATRKNLKKNLKKKPKKQ